MLMDLIENLKTNVQAGLKYIIHEYPVVSIVKTTAKVVKTEVSSKRKLILL